MMVSALLATFIGRRRFLSADYVSNLLRELEAIPDHIEKVVACLIRSADATSKYIERENWLFLGRGHNYPVALEGAAQAQGNQLHPRRGHARREMKHGPIALIDDGMPWSLWRPRIPNTKRWYSNIEEVRSRGGARDRGCD